MQASSRLPPGASKPVCRMALLALLAPDRRSAPFSSSSTRAPPSTNRRATAQPTTPPPGPGPRSKLVPPMTAAAMASSSRLTPPTPGLTTGTRAMMITAVKKTYTEDRRNPPTFSPPTDMPASSARAGCEPTAKVFRPKRVCRDSHQETTATAPVKPIVGCRPAPGAAPKARNAGSSTRMVPVVATIRVAPCTINMLASVAMNEGMRSQATSRPFRQPTSRQQAKPVPSAVVSAMPADSSVPIVTALSATQWPADRSMSPVSKIQNTAMPSIATGVACCNKTHRCSRATIRASAMPKAASSASSTSQGVWSSARFRSLLRMLECQAGDLLPGGAARQVAGHATAAEHHDAVGHAPNLGQLAGDHQDGQALFFQIGDQLVQLELGAHIDAVGRLVEQEQPGRSGEPFAQHDFLLVAPRQLVRQELRPGRAHIEPGDQPFGQPAQFAHLDKAGATVRADPAQAQVVLDGQAGNQALLVPPLPPTSPPPPPLPPSRARPRAPVGPAPGPRAPAGAGGGAGLARAAAAARRW